MPIDFITTNDTSLPPPRLFNATSLPLPRPFNDQLHDIFSTLETSGPAPLFENNGPLLPMPEGYTPPTANLPSLDSFNSALFHNRLILPLSQGYTHPTANPSSTSGLTDLLDVPLYPNWPGLPSNQPAIPTSSVSLHASVPQAGTLTSKTLAPFLTSVVPALHIPTNSISLYPSVTPAGTLTSKTPAPLPTSVAPALHIPSKTPAQVAIVVPGDATSTLSALPVINIAGLIFISMVPVEHTMSKMSALPVIKMPAVTLISMTTAEYVMSKMPMLPIIKLVDATSMLSALPLPTVKQPLLLPCPMPVLPTVQPL